MLENLVIFYFLIIVFQNIFKDKITSLSEILASNSKRALKSKFLVYDFFLQTILNICFLHGRTNTLFFSPESLAQKGQYYMFDGPEATYFFIFTCFFLLLILGYSNFLFLLFHLVTMILRFLEDLHYLEVLNNWLIY